MIQKIGCMGGTFNPVHLGHISVARAAHEELGLERIFMMPSKNPPHKQNIISEKDRCNMVRLAIEAYPYLEFSDLEIKRQGVTYSAETLALLKEKYEEIYFIIGADSFYDIEKWYHPEIVMRLAHLVVAPRTDARSKDRSPQRHKAYLEQTYGARIRFLNCPLFPISSSQIRSDIKNGKPVSRWIDEKVAEYITKEHLYE